MKIALIGESCIDEYVFGTCDRVCPEAAAMCFRSSGQTKSNLGMAGNVMSNIKSLNSDLKIDIYTNIDTKIIKRRFVDTKYNSIVFREDINDQCDRIDITKYDFENYDALVFSDYCKGFLEEEDIIEICKRKTTKCITIIDTKKRVKNISAHIDFIKINEKEHNDNIKDIQEITSNCHLIVTKGSFGASHMHKNYYQHYPTQESQISDVCGAGDTFLSGFIVHYLNSRNIGESINYANQCASKVVTKFGVVTP
jgi:D-beta-D-heptose 7-phosphate kinase/D-beta-D-heptose 1-phosphate adenosyltransferase